MMVPGRRLEAAAEILESNGGQAHETHLQGDKMKRRCWHQHSISSIGSHPHRFCPPCSRTPAHCPISPRTCPRPRTPSAAQKPEPQLISTPSLAVQETLAAPAPLPHPPRAVVRRGSLPQAP